MNIEIGYSLSSEEFSPTDLVRLARRAEDAGFSFALISDHYHPWTRRQGQSPFVWSVAGGIAQATKHLILGTGVTCPILRIHPAIIAQAAATTALMMPGRFFLGLGIGERLNEHILGAHWPPVFKRRAMLQEAVKILRLLWRGGNQNYCGEYFTVENAEVFSLPDKPPPIMIAAASPTSAELAGTIGDGLISTVPEETLVGKFRASDNGTEKPCYGQVTVCWAETEDKARRIGHDWWPIAAMAGPLMSELATPAQFEAAAERVSEAAVASKLVLGPDPKKHLAGIAEFSNAGFDHIYIHQVGPDQEGFFRFYEREILPELDKGRRHGAERLR